MLSRHFSVSEFERSATATARGISNRMGPREVANAKALCTAVLEPLRAVVGALNVNSGYRSPRLNAAIPGASNTSDHRFGRAADVETVAMPGHGGLSTRELFDVARLLRLPFDQIILEFPGPNPRDGWVHLGHRGSRSRGQVLIAKGGYRAFREPPVYTPAMTSLVRAFQERAGIGVDGLIGLQTRAKARSYDA